MDVETSIIMVIVIKSVTMLFAYMMEQTVTHQH